MSDKPDVSPEEQKPQQPTEPTTPAQEFFNKYKELCQKTGFQLVVEPAYVRRDDNTFSLIIKTSVSELLKEEAA